MTPAEARARADAEWRREELLNTALLAATALLLKPATPDALTVGMVAELWLEAFKTGAAAERTAVLAVVKQHRCKGESCIETCVGRILRELDEVVQP